MTDSYDRSDRFELIAACPPAPLHEHADAVLADDPDLRILQAPTAQLLRHQIHEPVARSRFNLGEVLVTTAEVELGAAKGYAMVPGRAEARALAGAVVDAAVAGGHPRSKAIAATLETAAAEREQGRDERWAEAQQTVVAFTELVDHT
jgi:alpha-D-ribose 1-methylphosphonate 5-triphosphate synthase subunit PhnG